MSNHKLLGPDRKSYTLSQLDRLSIRKVFDFLIDMGVSDDDQYQEFLDMTRKPRKRQRSRSRSSKKRRYVVYRRTERIEGSPRQSGVYRQKQPDRYSQPSSCPQHRSKSQCKKNDCYWTGASCLTP